LSEGRVRQLEHHVQELLEEERGLRRGLLAYEKIYSLKKLLEELEKKIITRAIKKIDKNILDRLDTIAAHIKKIKKEV